MSDLGTALRELADRQQPVGGQEPGELWSRGRQRVRRRRAIGAAVALALVAAVGTSVLVLPAPTVVMPAGEPHAPGIPKDIYTPTKHLAGTGEKGPLGQIAVMAGAERDHGLGLFGISARTGEYRFLDLPDAVPGPWPALSPDGNHIAYWYGPYPGSTPPPGDALAPAHGAAIYDTRTGAVQKAPIASATGVRPQTLTWFDDSTVFLVYAAKGRFPGRTWQVGSQPRPSRVLTLGSYWHNRDDSLLVGAGSTFRRYVVGKNGDLSNAPPGLRLPGSSSEKASYSAVSVSGGSVLAVPAVAGALPHPLAAGVYAPPGPGPLVDQPMDKVRRFTWIAQLQETLFLGWRNEHTALVIGMAKAATPELFEADLPTRRLHRLGVAEPQNWEPLITVAADLVSQPLVAGRRPPNPQFPVAWLSLGGLLAIAGAIWLVRRRRRA